jgi:predicted HTH transcriptional regulator
VAKYPEIESKQLEFKETVPESYRQLIRECVAFANTTGGSLVIGVRDKDQEVIGVPLLAVEKFIEDFPNSIHQAVHPTIMPQISTLNIEGRYLIKVAIPAGMSKPYVIQSEGNPGGIYIRSGTSTLKAKREHIEELKQMSGHIAYDAESVNCPTSALLPKLLTRIYGRHHTEKTLIADRVLVQTTDGSLKPTRAAVLMFAAAPQDYVAEAIVLVSHFRGTLGRDIIRTTELDGPIPELLDKTLSLTANWTETNFRLSGAKLRGVPLVPQIALREIIANALIHRKYAVAGAVKIAIYEDRLEIFSPGDLPAGIRIDDLGHGVTDLRNPLIAKYARKFKLMEKLGSGISVANQACKENSLRPPEFVEGANFFKATFHFEKSYSNTVSPDTLALQIAKDSGLVTKNDLVVRGIADRTASKTLSDLVERGDLQRIGRGPSTKYLLA